MRYIVEFLSQLYHDSNSRARWRKGLPGFQSYILKCRPFGVLWLKCLCLPLQGVASKTDVEMTWQNSDRDDIWWKTWSVIRFGDDSVIQFQFGDTFANDGWFSGCRFYISFFKSLICQTSFLRTTFPSAKMACCSGIDQTIRGTSFQNLCNSRPKLDLYRKSTWKRMFTWFIRTNSSRSICFRSMFFWVIFEYETVGGISSGCGRNHHSWYGCPRNSCGRAVSLNELIWENLSPFSPRANRAPLPRPRALPPSTCVILCQHLLA